MKDKEMTEDKNWEVECLANKVREVEMCKADKPELYSKAVKYLKKECKAINSLDDIRAKIAEEEDPKEEKEEESKEEDG